LQFFLDAKLPESVQEDLFTIASLINQPTAVRSSSLLEDSHYQPFAGIYNTYMIPSTEKNLDKKFEMLNQAIKSVYASAFFANSKAYMQATANVIDEEKMAVVLQEVCGRQYGKYFYPTLSGVARSLDYYPIPPEKPKDGTANIALGLGKYIVDGGLSLRFSPQYPKKIMQTATPDAALRETQKYFFALDLSPEKFIPSVNDSINLVKRTIKDAEKDGSIRKIASSYDLQNNIIRDGYNYAGKKLITVEIEFVVDLNVKKGEKIKFYLLQIRPIASKEQSVHLNPQKISPNRLLIMSNSALGNGEIEDVRDIIYVKPQTFEAANNRKTAELIGELNKKFLEKNRNYVLIGPGRWGSSDPWPGRKYPQHV